MKDALNTDQLRICDLVGDHTTLRDPLLSLRMTGFPRTCSFGHRSGFIGHWLTYGV